jgi:hypothetical protein
LVAIDDDEEDNGEDDEALEKEVALSGCVLARERIGDALEDWLSDDAVMPASAEEESSAPGCAASFSALSTSCSKI